MVVCIEQETCFVLNLKQVSVFWEFGPSIFNCLWFSRNITWNILLFPILARTTSGGILEWFYRWMYKLGSCCLCPYTYPCFAKDSAVPHLVSALPLPSSLPFPASFFSQCLPLLPLPLQHIPLAQPLRSCQGFPCFPCRLCHWCPCEAYPWVSSGFSPLSPSPSITACLVKLFLAVKFSTVKEQGLSCAWCSWAYLSF